MAFISCTQVSKAIVDRGKVDVQTAGAPLFSAGGETGKGLVITDRAKPVLRIVPYAADPAELLRPIRNSVLKYDDPTAPVGLEDWEALRNDSP
jgi:hypothetical protein